MSYATLKLIHVSAVVLSFTGFTARGIGALQGASWVRQRLARTVPHLIDTILLLSALGMLWVVRLSPWSLPWLRAKIIGLVVYIALGMLALRPSITARLRRPKLARPRRVHSVRSCGCSAKPSIARNPRQVLDDILRLSWIRLSKMSIAEITDRAAGEWLLG